VNFPFFPQPTPLDLKGRAVKRFLMALGAADRYSLLRECRHLGSFRPEGTCCGAPYLRPIFTAAKKCFFICLPPAPRFSYARTFLKERNHFGNESADPLASPPSISVLLFFFSPESLGCFFFPFRAPLRRRLSRKHSCCRASLLT